MNLADAGESRVVTGVRPARSRWVLAAALVALALSVLAFAESAHAGFWLPIAFGILELAAAAILLTWPRARVVALNVISVSGILILVEAYFVYAGRPYDPTLKPPLGEWRRMRESLSADVYFYPEPPWYTDPQVGSMHKPNSKTRERRYVAGRLVSDAVYTTGRHGFRVTKPADADADAVLLFGCSMTWGQNLQDQESYPWQLGELLGSRTQVLNFGLSGSGPNAMLRMIEAGYERESLPRGGVRAAYYLAWLEPNIGHLARVLGRIPWGASAPRYVRASSGPTYVVADGRLPLTFDQWLTHQSAFTAQIGRSLGARRINPHYHQPDLALLEGLVLEANRLLREHDMTELRVLLLTHPAAADLEQRFSQDLARHGIRVLPLRLPRQAYTPRDIHPNAFGARLLAEAVFNDLQQPRQAAVAAP
ncbi:MAG: hypothetical protein ACOY0T_14850 [Myxococcota bacterium]